jgi:putative peptidoglycan lipid II flippase
VVVVTLSISLSIWLKETRLGASGLALANSAAFTVGALWLWFSVRSVLPAVRSGPVLLTLVKSVLASLAPAAVILGVRRLGSDWWSRGSSFAGLGIVAGIGIGTILIAAGVLLVLREPAITMLLRREVPGDST